MELADTTLTVLDTRRRFARERRRHGTSAGAHGPSILQSRGREHLARLDSIQTAGDAKDTVFVSADSLSIRCACKPSAFGRGSGRAAVGLHLQHLSDTGAAVTLVP